jgi:hypothetical protein
MERDGTSHSSLRVKRSDGEPPHSTSLVSASSATFDLSLDAKTHPHKIEDGVPGNSKTEVRVTLCLVPVRAMLSGAYECGNQHPDTAIRSH